MQPQADDHIRFALAHVCRAIEGYECTAAEAYAAAAYETRLTNYANHCVKRALLQRIKADLKLLDRSLSAPVLLAAEER